MRHEFVVLVVASVLFVGMLLCLEIGRRIGIRRLHDDSGAGAEGLGVIDGAVFAVLGLLIAFTFSGASARFDLRRQPIVEERSAIGTAYLRLDMLGAEAQPALRDSSRAYLDARLDAYRKFPDATAVRKGFDRANEISGRIWRQAVEAVRSKDALPTAALLLLPALSAMIDIATNRTMALLMAATGFTSPPSHKRRPALRMEAPSPLST